MKIFYFISTILLLNIIAIFIAVLLGGENSSEYFKEAKFITILSYIQLLICSGISWKVFELRRGESKSIDIKTQYFIWAIISIGFLYLSLDEIALFHENIDKLIHYVFGIKETALTDRIDDLILSLYGIIGILIIYYYREEFKYYPYFKVFIFIGFIFMFGKVIIDILTNRNDILPHVFNENTLFLVVKPWLEVIEGSFKLFAEAFFMGSFYYCYILSSEKSIQFKSN